MIKILRQLHRVYYLSVLLILSVLFYPFMYVAASNSRWFGYLNHLRVWHSQISSILAGIFFKFDFEEQLDPLQTYIYCANHSSNLDIIIMCILARRNFHFMGKEELLSNPVLKLFFNTIDIPVNRESRISAFRAFKKAAQNLQQGRSLIIFPEGKIDDTHYPPQLIEFKNGPFRLAIENNIPIVPVSIRSAWKLLWDDGRKKGSRPGLCEIYIHKPIFTEKLDVLNDELLKQQVFNAIASKLVR